MSDEDRAAATASTTTKTTGERIKEVGKDIGKEVVIALIGVILTVLFEFVTLGIVKSEEIKKIKENQAEMTNMLAVQFDLYIIALTLILGSAASRQYSGRSFQSLVLVFVSVLLLLFALPIISIITPEHLSSWFRIWIPDIIGFGLIWIAAHTVRRT